MGIIPLAIILYFLIGKDNPDVYRFVHDKLGKIILAIIIISACTSAIPALLGLTIGFFFMAAPFITLGWLVKKLKGDKKRKDDYERSAYTGADRKANRAYQSKKKHAPLPSSVSKRYKIVEKFNKKFDLTLSETEIDRIVDASYASLEWEVEIFAMTQEYSNINEWYRGATGFVRAYLRAFAVQQISSDFKLQEKIIFDSFDQIFREVRPETFPSVDACVESINNRYLTLFDEATFMVAYRYLQSKGKDYKLPSANLSSYMNSLDELKKKYDDISETANTDNSLDDLADSYDRDATTRRRR